MAESSTLGRHFTARGLALDAGQALAAAALDHLHQRARQASPRSLRRVPPLGAYLWGEPGRGKTMLMDGLFGITTLPARRIHYHQFLRDLHRGRAQAPTGQADYLVALARDVARQCRIFCLDEFHLHDVADAILMQRFLEVLLEERVLVVLTSNYAPESLLPDPILHRHALPVIHLIRQHMQVVQLDGAKDYRYREAVRGEQYLHPCGPETESRLRALLEDLGLPVETGAGKIKLCGRDVAVRALGERCAWFDFESICLGPRSHLDYLEISERWDAVVVSGIRQAQLNKPDGLRRFIWLVDILYDRRQRLLLEAERDIESMLRAVTLSVDTHRTLSRLAEMQSADFALATPLENSLLCP